VRWNRRWRATATRRRRTRTPTVARRRWNATETSCMTERRSRRPPSASLSTTRTTASLLGRRHPAASTDDDLGRKGCSETRSDVCQATRTRRPILRPPAPCLLPIPAEAVSTTSALRSSKSECVFVSVGRVVGMDGHWCCRMPHIRGAGTFPKVVRLKDRDAKLLKASTGQELDGGVSPSPTDQLIWGSVISCRAGSKSDCMCI